MFQVLITIYRFAQLIFGLVICFHIQIIVFEHTRDRWIALACAYTLLLIQDIAMNANRIEERTKP